MVTQHYFTLAERTCSTTEPKRRRTSRSGAGGVVHAGFRHPPLHHQIARAVFEEDRARAAAAEPVGIEVPPPKLLHTYDRNEVKDLRAAEVIAPIQDDVLRLRQEIDAQTAMRDRRRRAGRRKRLGRVNLDRDRRVLIVLGLYRPDLELLSRQLQSLVAQTPSEHRDLRLLRRPARAGRAVADRKPGGQPHPHHRIRRAGRRAQEFRPRPERGRGRKPKRHRSLRLLRSGRFLASRKTRAAGRRLCRPADEPLPLRCAHRIAQRRCARAFAVRARVALAFRARSPISWS